MTNSKVLRKQAKLDLLAECLSTAEMRLEYLHDRVQGDLQRLDDLPEDEREICYLNEQICENQIRESAVLELIKELEKLL